MGRYSKVGPRGGGKHYPFKIINPVRVMVHVEEEIVELGRALQAQTKCLVFYPTRKRPLKVFK